MFERQNLFSNCGSWVAPDQGSSCRSAISTAEEAKHSYESAAADLKTQIAAGGHPGTAEEQNVTDLLNTAKTAVWNAMQVCKGMHEHHHSGSARSR